MLAVQISQCFIYVAHRMNSTFVFLHWLNSLLCSLHCYMPLSCKRKCPAC